MCASVAVEARSTEKGNTKMLALVEKMKHSAPIKAVKTDVGDCTFWCCGEDNCICCPSQEFTCCAPGSPYVCAGDADDCDGDSKMMMGQYAAKAPKKPLSKVGDDCPLPCPGDWCCPDDTLICCDLDSPWICADTTDDC